MMDPQDDETFEMALDHEKADKKERAAPWLVSFGDVTALMLTFFVMLYSMSYIPSEKWEMVVSMISMRVDNAVDEEPRATSDLTIENVSLINALPTAYLNRIFQEKFARDPILNTAQVREMDDQVVISLPSTALFASGSAQLLPEAEESIFRLSGALSQIGNRLDVQGNTDPDPPIGDRFTNNWSLSLARALQVVNELQKAGYPGGLTAVGLGDSQYKHLDRRLSEEKRYALSRRVDLVILPDAGGQ